MDDVVDLVLQESKDNAAILIRSCRVVIRSLRIEAAKVTASITQADIRSLETGEARNRKRNKFGGWRRSTEKDRILKTRARMS